MKSAAAALIALLRSLRVECELVYPGAPEVKHADSAPYLIEQLKEN